MYHSILLMSAYLIYLSILTFYLISVKKNNDISLYLGLFEKSPTVLRKAIVTTPYSGWIAMVFALASIGFLPLITLQC